MQIGYSGLFLKPSFCTQVFPMQILGGETVDDCLYISKNCFVPESGLLHAKTFMLFAALLHTNVLQLPLLVSCVIVPVQFAGIVLTSKEHIGVAEFRFSFT